MEDFLNTSAVIKEAPSSAVPHDAAKGEDIPRLWMVVASTNYTSHANGHKQRGDEMDSVQVSYDLWS